MGFGIGIVIGTGIFTLTGIEAKNHAGPGVVISFAIAGVVSLLAALCYAELAVRRADGRQRLHLRLRDDRRDLRVDHRLGPDPRVRPRRRGRRPRAGRATCRSCSACRPSIFGEELDRQRRRRRDRAGARRRRDRRHPRVRRGSPTRWSSSRSRSASSSSSPARSSSRRANLIAVRPGRRARSPEGTSGLKQPLWQALFGHRAVGLRLRRRPHRRRGGVLRLHRLRGRGQPRRGDPATRPRTCRCGLLGTLAICTVLYIGVSLCITGMVKYDRISEGAPIANAFDAGRRWAGPPCWSRSPRSPG